MYYTNSYFRALQYINNEFKYKKYIINSYCKILDKEIQQIFTYTNINNITDQYTILVLNNINNINSINIINSKIFKVTIPIKNSNLLYTTYIKSVDDLVNYICYHLYNE